MPVLCGGACVAPQAPNCATIIDSGTSLLVAPTAHVGALLDLVEEEAPGVLEKLYKQTVHGTFMTKAFWAMTTAKGRNLTIAADAMKSGTLNVSSRAARARNEWPR